MGFFDNHGLSFRQKKALESERTTDLLGIEKAQEEAKIPEVEGEKEIERSLRYGLEAAPSIGDRTISTFTREPRPAFAGIPTFLRSPFLEDVRRVGEYDVAFIGVPFDIGTTYRAGARFGPEAIRRISKLYTSYSYEYQVDLKESLKMCDVGDVFTIANIEKSFDQIYKAVSHVFAQGTLPVMLGGDHAIGYPCLRAIADNVDGKVGIIHMDRHLDLQEKDMDERMHTTPWFHATNIPNAPPENLVQVGIGGWQVPREAVKNVRKFNTTVITMGDIEKHGIDRIADIALEKAWKGAKAVYLSVDIDSFDSGFVPGTGWPEPGGFLPREGIQFVSRVASEGICGMELVEVSPPYDVSDQTALLGTRVISDVLAAMVKAGKLGKKFT
ncbi:agmatinase [Ornithinibacillus sp. L9]|uniref:Agmatinase n=1 Tax=Ornithinibacillus caprae TaxID=2678566 RepID=A0A6N8FFW2_9BACI|nr:agmatinase family protein [Ornithinibacillus caprae]MUK88552.1 agmatinase [Ornithinibacillus caprae]